VSCRPATVVDGYGSSLDRNKACYDPTKTVIITIVDACPCSYPNNEYSNKRWCVWLNVRGLRGNAHNGTSLAACLGRKAELQPWPAVSYA
jgi:hypothetical protein